jgi:hypothetical protein
MGRGKQFSPRIGAELAFRVQKTPAPLIDTIIHVAEFPDTL